MNISEKSVDSHKITEKKAELLYSQTPISNGAVLLIALLYFFFLKNYSELFVPVIWSFMLSIIACYRLFLWYQRRYQRNKTADRYTSEQWIRNYIIATGLAGCAWSSIFLLPYTHYDAPLYAALAMVFFGVTASAVPVLTVSLTAFFCYTAPIIISFIIGIYQLNGFSYLFFTLGAMIYYLMLSLLAVNSNKQIISSIKLTLHNQLLIHQLQQETEERGRLVQERTKQLFKTDKAMVETKQRLQDVITGAELGYWDWNYQTGAYEVNDRWLEILGLTREDINNDVSDWGSRIHPDDRECIMATVEKSIKTNMPYVGDFRMKHRDGHWVWIQGSGSLIKSDKLIDEPLRLCGIHQDISYRKQMEQELEFRARHDYLTGLYNRIELEKECQEEMKRAQRYRRTLSIFLLDIDHFKQINDTYGHLSGDQVLKQFAAFLQQTVRATDYVARYGGEEFVVILPETSLKKAEELAERLRMQTEELNIALKQTTLKITISIGISSYPEHGKSYEQLLEAADSAMYQAKMNGRNCVRSVTVT